MWEPESIFQNPFKTQPSACTCTHTCPEWRFREKTDRFSELSKQFDLSYVVKYKSKKNPNSKQKENENINKQKRQQQRYSTSHSTLEFPYKCTHTHKTHKKYWKWNKDAKILYQLFMTTMKCRIIDEQVIPQIMRSELIIQNVIQSKHGD